MARQSQDWRAEVVPKPHLSKVVPEGTTPPRFARPPPNLGGELVSPSGYLDAGPIAKAVDQMIVDHAHGLHMRVDDRGADEAESTPLQIFTELIGLG